METFETLQVISFISLLIIEAVLVYLIIDYVKHTPHSPLLRRQAAHRPPQAEAPAPAPQDPPTEPTAQTATEPERKDFLRSLIDGIGAHVISESDKDTRFLIKYQGGVFLVDYEDQSPWLLLTMPRIHEIPLADIDRVAEMRKAVNELNSKPYFWNIFYNVDTEDRMMYFHLNAYLLLMPDMPQPKAILEAYLDGAYRRQQSLLIASERMETQNAQQ